MFFSERMACLVGFPNRTTAESLRTPGFSNAINETERHYSLPQTEAEFMEMLSCCNAETLKHSSERTRQRDNIETQLRGAEQASQQIRGNFNVCPQIFFNRLKIPS